MKRELTINEKDMLIKGLTMIKNEKEAMLKNISKTNAVIGGAIGSAVASIGSALGSSTPTAISAGLTGAAGATVLPAAVAIGSVAIIGGFLLGHKMSKKECLTKDEQIEQLKKDIYQLQNTIEDVCLRNELFLRHEIEVVYQLSKLMNINMYSLVNSDLSRILNQLDFVKGMTEDEIKEKYKKVTNIHNLDNIMYKDTIIKVYTTLYFWVYEQKRYQFDKVKELTYDKMLDFLYSMYIQK